ncbi:alpha-N-arabinofuranosidase [Agromyces allii]|uniref:non-reducing end alpha-L-arabinofuranosidase n=1 Tax=Agromyces allii TaxID=393607 RepID=A0ABP5BZA5_9MICO|nr:alpha-L-arabinofuranosidase C-terminal domain-containing protein [Agromyces allii]
MTTGTPKPDLPSLRAVINFDLPGPTISRHVYGHFAEHLGRCIYDGFFIGDRGDVPTEGGIRLDVVEALRALRIPNLRWPGGCFADEYHWHDGVGPTQNRPTMVNSNWGDVVEDNSFGTHEFMALCELLDAEPYISANVGSGTAREAGEWIEYLTRSDDSPMARLRRENGRDEPWKVRFWGLGNEPWGCGGRFGPKAYAQVARTFGTYSRDHNGNKLYRIAAGASTDDYQWTEVLMQELGFAIGSGEATGPGVGAYDAISFHYYTLPGTWAQKGSATQFDTEEYYRTLAEATRIETLLAGHSAIMDAYDPGKTIGLVLDEWGTWFDVEPGTNPGFLYQQNTLRDAIVAGVHFDAFHRHADRLTMANIAQTVNVLQAMILTDGAAMVLTPTYHVFEMNSGHQDATSHSVDLLDEVPSVLSGERAVPHISTSASSKDGQALISITNAHATDSAWLEFELRGAKVAGVAGRILTAPTLQAHNSVDVGDAVSPRPFEDVRMNGTTLLVRVPQHSFVTVQLELD